MNKKICIVTSTRAEYGLLRPLMSLFNNSNKYELQIIATGMHLSPEFGNTYKEIENDGFKIDEKVEILLSSDSAIGVSKAMGLATISFSEAFNRLKPDMVIVLGDRYEIFSVCSAAVVANIPIAHLHGGEATEGAFDEAFRHSITKMSYLHFTSTEEYRRRVIQLGEFPDRVFNVGAIGVENILSLDLLDKERLERSINFKLDKPFALVTFHPVTLDKMDTLGQVKILLEVLSSRIDMKFIITKANSDTEGRLINKVLEEYASNNSDKVILFTSMGILRYLSAMKYSSCVIGNSSSGIIEAPTFKIPTINIGDRQKGRIQAKSIINCNASKNEIIDALKLSSSNEFKSSIKSMENPYGDGNTSKKIFEIIDKAFRNEIRLKKVFYDIK